jgi:hypothetical protein
MENLWSRDNFTDYEAKNRILNLPSNHRSVSRASSKNSKSQYKANRVSWSNGQKVKKKKTGSSASSNSGGKECNWYHKHSPGTAAAHIWIQYKELNARSDRNGAKMAAPIQEVANTVSFNSSTWIVDTGAYSHTTPNRNCLESFSSVRGKIVYPDKTQVDSTGVGLVRLPYCLPSGDISVVLLHRVLIVPSVQTALYSWNSLKSIGKFVLINDGTLQVVHKTDISVVINSCQSSNDFVLDLVPSESASLADDMDYDFYYALLGHPFKANVIRKLYQDGYLIPDYSSTFTCNRYPLSK